MFKLVKAFLSNPVRVKADNFISNLNESKIKSVEVTEKAHENYDQIFNEAYKALTNFISDTEDQDNFLKSLENFNLCQRLKPSQPEPYFYLSYIFHICGETQLAINYLNAIKFINPDYEGLQALEDEIIKSISIKTEPEFVIPEPDKKSPVKPEIKRIPYSQVKSLNQNRKF
jgi:hypothetical protein